MGVQWFGRSRRGSDGGSGCRRIAATWIFVVALLGGCDFERQVSREAPGPEGNEETASEEIRGMLQASTASWNAGNLEGFLDDYWRSEDLTFSGATGVTRGWEDVRTRYLESYWAPGSARDSLRFEDLEVVPLGEEHAFALGRYVLSRPEDGGVVTSSGFFSLILEKMEGEWKIVHDHTSGSPVETGSGEGGS